MQLMSQELNSKEIPFGIFSFRSYEIMVGAGVKLILSGRSPWPQGYSYQACQTMILVHIRVKLSSLPNCAVSSIN